MFTIHQLSVSLLGLSLALASASAQTPNSHQEPAAKTSIIIERQFVRFTTSAEAAEWRLVVTNQQAEVVFDSGLLYGPALEWPLKNQQGEVVASGLYAYTLTTKTATDETLRTQRGHLIVDRASSTDRIWFTSNQEIGLGAGSGAPQVTVVGSRETTLGGAELPSAAPRRETSEERPELPQRTSADTTAAKAAGPAVPNGTANRVAKFDSTGTSLVDSAISEVGGQVGIGTTNPQAGFDYRGSTAAFYTRDIGTNSFGIPQSALQLGVSNLHSRNVGVGPSMLFHAENSAGAKSFLGRVSGAWENPTAGAEAGALFFQVRANSGDTTASTERMRITASGHVGIGTTAPQGRLEVVGNGASVVIGDPNCGAGSNTVAIGFLTNAALNCGNNFNFGASTMLKETVINRPVGGQISFREGNIVNQMRIMPGGDVVIGGSDSRATLTVYGGNNGVYGSAGPGAGVRGESTFGRGVSGYSYGGHGVSGSSDSGKGVSGFSNSSYGVLGSSSSSSGVRGQSDTGVGVFGTSDSWIGVQGNSLNSYAVAGYTTNGTGIYGSNGDSNHDGHAGYFNGRVRITGNLTVEDFIVNPSDVRLKQQVKPLGYGLAQVLQLRPVTWQWKDRPTTQLNLGLIAQEVEPLLPELILREADPAKPLGLNYLGLAPVVIKAIQEQQSMLASKEAEINALKSANAALEARLSALEELTRQIIERCEPARQKPCKDQP